MFVSTFHILFALSLVPLYLNVSWKVTPLLISRSNVKVHTLSAYFTYHRREKCAIHQSDQNAKISRSRENLVFLIQPRIDTASDQTIAVVGTARTFLRKHYTPVRDRQGLDAGCERNREARKYGVSDGEILRWQTVVAVLKLSVRRAPLRPPPFVVHTLSSPHFRRY